MTHNNSFDLRIVFMVSLPRLRISDAESFAENFTDGLQGHTLALRIEEQDEEPAKETDAGIEAKSTTWGPAFHH